MPLSAVSSPGNFELLSVLLHVSSVALLALANNRVWEKEIDEFVLWWGGLSTCSFQFNNGHCSLRIEVADPGVAQRRVPADGVDSFLGDLGDFRPLRVGAKWDWTSRN